MSFAHRTDQMHCHVEIRASAAGPGPWLPVPAPLIHFKHRDVDVVVCTKTVAYCSCLRLFKDLHISLMFQDGFKTFCDPSLC